MSDRHLAMVELKFTASVPPEVRRKDWLAHLDRCGLCELLLAGIEKRESDATFNWREPMPNRGTRVNGGQE